MNDSDIPQEIRKQFKLRLTWAGFVVLLIPAIWVIYQKYVSFDLVMFLGYLLLSLIVSGSISNWIAVKKFGAVEKEEQEVAAKERQERRAARQSSKNYKLGEYIKRQTAIYFFVLVIFLSLAPMFILDRLGREDIGHIIGFSGLFIAWCLAIWIAGKKAKVEFKDK